MLIALVRSLSINKCAKDTIKDKYPETNTKQNNIASILFALFVLWNQLSEKFYSH